MKLLIFKLNLLFHLGLFVLKLLFGEIKKVRFLFLISFFMILVLSLLFFIFTKNRAYKNESLSEFSYSPTRPELYSKSIKTNSELQEETAYWENIIEKQPNSRDALINLSILKKLSNQNEESTRLWDKAKLIDPNHPVFQN